jgi:hypothetical protein
MLMTVEGMKFRVNWQHTKTHYGPYFVAVDKATYNPITDLFLDSRSAVEAVKSVDSALFTEAKIVRLYPETMPRHRGQTVCTIDLLDNDSVFQSNATVRCVPNDLYIKDKARKNSLTKAAATVALWFSDDEVVQRKVVAQFMRQYHERKRTV